MYGTTDIREGMTVRSTDGEKLGKVYAIGSDAFLIEKGFFFPKEYRVLWSEVSDIRDGEIVLRSGTAALREAGGATSIGTSAYDSTLSSREGLRDGEELRVPVVEEELEAVKTERDAGAVRIHKTVVQEMKTIDVPVLKERVEVERIPVSAGSAAAESTGAAFQSEDIVVPVREEEVEIRKRPVVKEEIRVRKDRTVEERRVADTTRREEVEIDRDDTTEPRTDVPGWTDPNTRY